MANNNHEYLIYSSVTQVNYKLHPRQGLVEIIDQLRPEERQSHDTIASIADKWICVLKSLSIYLSCTCAFT